MSKAAISSAPRSSRPSEKLFARAKRGDTGAFDDLIARYLPRLHRWAHGRLSRAARSRVETADVVQDAAARTIERRGRIELSTERALDAYLRRVILNRIHDEHRYVARHGVGGEVPELLPDGSPSPHHVVVMAELEERYRRALTRLRPTDHELVVGHIELDYSHEQLGRAVARSPNAARMALQRALCELAQHMLEK